jgi:3-deoxy-D-manno-octulosonic-acid transferase
LAKGFYKRISKKLKNGKSFFKKIAKSFLQKIGKRLLQKNWKKTFYKDLGIQKIWQNF